MRSQLHERPSPTIHYATRQPVTFNFAYIPPPGPRALKCSNRGLAKNAGMAQGPSAGLWIWIGS